MFCVIPCYYFLVEDQQSTEEEEVETQEEYLDLTLENSPAPDSQGNKIKLVAMYIFSN